SVHVSADLGECRDWLAGLAEQGVDEIHLHQVGRNQEAFIAAFGTEVLPELTASQGSAKPAMRAAASPSPASRGKTRAASTADRSGTERRVTCPTASPMVPVTTTSAAVTVPALRTVTGRTSVSPCRIGSPSSTLSSGP